MKHCPVCNATVFEDMDRCYGCLYQFGSGSETTEFQKAGGPEGPERCENAAEPEDVTGFGSTEMPGERLGIRDMEMPDRTAERTEAGAPSATAGSDTAGEADTTAKPQEPQDLHETEGVCKTRMPVLEIRRDPHDQTALTVRLELHLDFDPAQQAALREEQHALAPH